MAVTATNPEWHALASSVGALPDLLSAVAELAIAAEDIAVLVALGRNENTPMPLRIALADHTDVSVRVAALEAGLLPIEEVLARRQDSAVPVRACIAALPGLDDVAIEEYLLDVAEVRTALAGNGELSIEQLRRLLADSEAEVRAAARNEASSRGMHVEDEEEELPAQVFPPGGGCVVGPNGGGFSAPAPAPLTPAEQEALANGELREQLRAASLPELSGTARSLTAASTNILVRAAFARRNDLDAAERQAVFTDSELEVRAGYAGGSATQAELETLAGDPEARVRAAAATRVESHVHRLALATDPSTVVHQSLTHQIELLELDVVCALAHSPESRVRRSVALNRVEPERLDHLVAAELIEWKVTDWEQRLAQLVAGEAYLKARELAPEFPVPLAELAQLAPTLV